MSDSVYFLQIPPFGRYSRTPLLRPPSKSDWSGRKRGVVVHEGLDYCITCALWYTRISYCSNSFVHVENVFRRVHCRTRENASTYPLQRLQARPRSPRLTANEIVLIVGQRLTCRAWAISLLSLNSIVDDGNHRHR